MSGFVPSLSHTTLCHIQGHLAFYHNIRIILNRASSNETIVLSYSPFVNYRHLILPISCLVLKPVYKSNVKLCQRYNSTHSYTLY
jgi:hypothetical protein